ncbi:MAG: PAS domain-containing protein [Polyangiaceae bacterium]|nr:PAS domain-containing protein [Polyangiaceae bacterium]
MDQHDPDSLREAVARLQHENRSLREALATTDRGSAMREQGEEFARLLSLSKLIVAELDLAKVFELVADHAREIVKAELLIVPVLSAERDRYTYVAASGADAERVRGTGFAATVGMCGWVLSHGQSLLFGETSTQWLAERTTWEAGQQSAVLVPLIGRKGILGGLSALGKQGGGCFTQHDLELLTMFANQVSIAIENARLFEQVTREMQERKQAEEAAHESRNLLRQILNAMPHSVFWKDRESVYLGCNEVFARAVGLDAPSAIVGKTDFDLPWPSSEAQAYRSDDQEVITGKRTKLHIVEPLQQLDGSRIWIDTSKVPLLDREGTVFGVLGVFQDITTRKLAEEKLQNSERRLAESQKVARLGSWDLDLVHQRVDWSVETYRLFDRSPEDFTPTFADFARCVHPEDRATMEKNLERALSSAAHPYHVTVRIINASGRPWVMEAIGEVRRDGDGVPLGIFGTAQDITERERAEEQIRQNEQFIRSILNTVDEGFIVVDRDYRILTANHAYCVLSGEPRERVVGRHCYELLHRERQPCFVEGSHCAVRGVFATGEAQTALHKHRDADGSVVYVETKAYPMKDAGGQVISAIETVTNITEKHLLEEERLKTQKLESIGTLAGGIAHDFNNLLQGMFGYISMAKVSVERPNEVLAMLDGVDNALHQAVKLTTQLLTFSRGGKPVMRRIDLRAVVEDSAKFTLSGSRSDLGLELPGDLWLVEADDGQVGQVIQNIVLNADQAMPTGGSVRVAARNVTEDDAALPRALPRGNYVAISIQDSGVGIAAQDLDKIFDPYFTTKEKGSGLGLATSYSIVKNHGGLIDVRSQLGAGSTFTIYLPAAAGRTRTEVAAAAARPVPGRTARILVMDDEELIRKLTGELLRVLGHDVAVARHGQEAVEAYERAMARGEPFDVVILDLTVRGGMGGEEALQRLRALDPAVKAIVSSGYSDDASMADHLAHGFKAYLKKPYDLDALREAVKSLLA